jgi:hypothetical protein
MRLGSDLTDERIASMTEAELQAWVDAEGLGSWLPNVVEPLDRTAGVAITIAVPEDLAAELRAEAALRQQPHLSYLKDLLLFALRQVQADRRRA